MTGIGYADIATIIADAPTDEIRDELEAAWDDTAGSANALDLDFEHDPIESERVWENYFVGYWQAAVGTRSETTCSYARHAGLEW
jgi:hypothetical protein